MTRKIRVTAEIGIPTSTGEEFDSLQFPAQHHDLPYGWDDWNKVRQDAYLIDIADAEIPNHTIATATVVDVNEG